MSQHWHGHWTNDAFKPVRLKNWEVPNWHPCWPDKHCRVTRFMADNNGRILVGQKKPLQSPWGDFKGTWELPNKITRQKAYELSAPRRYKITAWEQHKKVNQETCKTIRSTGVLKGSDKNQSPTTVLPDNVDGVRVSHESEPKLSPPPSTATDNTAQTSCPIHNSCQI